ncbi:MAG: hypothetical protein R6W94_11765, partial [Spirochaetia bacterium]
MTDARFVSSRTPSLFTVLLVAALLFGASGPGAPRLQAQESQPAQAAFSGVRVYVVPLLQVGPSPDLSAVGGDLTELLSESLYTEFSDAGFEIIVGDPIPEPGPTAAPGRIAD